MKTKDDALIHKWISDYRAQRFDTIPIDALEKIQDVRVLQNKYPQGANFTGEGFIDLTPYAREKVKITLSDRSQKDIELANKMMGYKETPEGMTWHHHDKTGKMLLVPEDLHDAIRHTGGSAMHKESTKGKK